VLFPAQVGKPAATRKLITLPPLELRFHLERVGLHLDVAAEGREAVEIGSESRETGAFSSVRTVISSTRTFRESRKVSESVSSYRRKVEAEEVSLMRAAILSSVFGFSSNRPHGLPERRIKPHGCFSTCVIRFGNHSEAIA
jgi:hypothetical protein